MVRHPDSSSENTATLAFSALRIQHLINSFRFLVSLILVLVVSFVEDVPFLTDERESLFIAIAGFYFVFSFVVFFISRGGVRTERLFVIVVLDIITLTLLTYFSGGVSSGIALLIIVFLMGVGVLVDKRLAAALAAVASIALLLEESIAFLEGGGGMQGFSQAGILGGVFFVAALLSVALAQRVKHSEMLAEQRGVDLANMEKLNEYIIQRMASGVLVVDRQKNIRLINEAAWYLLGLPVNKTITNVEQLSRELSVQLDKWFSVRNYEPHVFRVTASANIYPRFIGLGEQQSAGALVILEDTSIMNQQAQHLKMTALGRLTASIAHEIRNPLGAISHAAQLLAESNHLDMADQRLTQIIRENSVRTNTIIENVMQLTRRDQAKPETIELKTWLQNFLQEFARNHNIEANEVGLDIAPADTSVVFDPSHLHQILSNLCQNALKHGVSAEGVARFELRGGLMRESRGPFLDVIDYGPGISPELADQIFEPFFTTATKGTGLGLYIAKELSEANQAHLDYVPVPAGGSCFRITFASKRTEK